MEKTIVDIPYKNLNKRIYYWGYKPMQLLVFAGALGVMIIICVFFSSGVARFVITPVVTVPVLIVMGRVRKQNKSGVPDYVASMLLHFTCPRMISDKGFVMRKVHNNKTIQ